MFYITWTTSSNLYSPRPSLRLKVVELDVLVTNGDEVLAVGRDVHGVDLV